MEADPNEGQSDLYVIKEILNAEYKDFKIVVISKN